MGTWHEYLKTEGTPPEWPYPIKFGEESEYEADVVVIGGGIAGSWAAISAARTGAKVILMEKADVRRSGSGGPGCDHWCNVPANPHSKVDPDEWAQRNLKLMGNFSNGIGIQIQCREDFDTLLEMEQMGGKIRDTDDEFVGVEGRYDDTKFMFSPRYSKSEGTIGSDDWQDPNYNPADQRLNMVIRIWGSTFKPTLKKECKRLGVQVMDRVMVTSLLNEGGKQGARVVGATGINTRTGEFIIVKAKAAIIATAGQGQMWHVDMEHGGYTTMSSRTQCSDGLMMALKAGADLTMMEGTARQGIAGGLKHKWYTGAGDASYENVPMVDANNKRVPLPTQGWPDGGYMYPKSPFPYPPVIQNVLDGVKEGKYELPLYGDFAGMKPEESNATWNLMLTEESTTKVMVQDMTKAGFDINRDQILAYDFIELQTPAQWHGPSHGGGMVVDWDLKSTLDGLYAAGGSIFCPGDHSYCAATGRYAGRKAAAYAKTATAGEVSRSQIDAEKERVLAPTKRTGGIEWKELQNGFGRTMQYFCSQYKSENLLKMGLEELERIEERAVPQLYALDPHKLMRSIEDLFLLENAKVKINAILDRKLSARELNVERLDYPERDEEELKQYQTVHMEDGKLVFGRLPIRYWGDMKEGYEAHNQDYTGVYKPE